MSLEAEPIRIAFVLHVMQVAGAEMLVAAIIRRLGERLAPVVICVDDIGQLGEAMLAEGVPVVALGRRPGLDLSTSRRLARLLRDRRIEVIHAHQYTPFFYSALARLQLRRQIHLIFTEHGRHYPDIVSTKRRIANRLVLARLANDVTAVCAFSARRLADVEGFAHRPIHVIRNGIDVPMNVAHEPRPELRARLGLSPNRRYVICVARFHPVKDHATLLRAFAIVAAQRVDTDLLLVGDGPLRGQLERQADELGLGLRIRFLGIRSDVSHLLRAADLFTLTSLSEAASLTLLEAMAAQTPVVVTDVGGNPEIVRDGIEGKLFPRGDAHQGAAALLAVLNDDAMAAAMGHAGWQRVATDYRIEDTIDAYYGRFVSAVERLPRRRR